MNQMHKEGELRIVDKIIIFGNGQVASVNYAYLMQDPAYRIAAFTVDRKFIKEQTLFGLPVVPFEDIELRYPPGEFKMSIFISYRNRNRLRAEKYRQAKEKGYRLINYISPKAVTFRDLVIGDNCFIWENASVGPYATIGNNVFIGPGCAIGHNTVIKDHCFLGPHAVILGSTTVEPYCFIGANSTVKDGGIVIARDNIIGANTFIRTNTRERGVYMGNPARLLRVTELTSWLTWG